MIRIAMPRFAGPGPLLRAICLALTLAPFLAVPVVLAQAAEAKTQRFGASGHPLPRFVSLGSHEINLRTGPGRRYPIAWVYVRRDLPVLVTREWENWRKVRDSDGVEGWVHRSLLSGRRHAMVTGDIRTLRREPAATAAPVLRAEPGVIGLLLACKGEWCRLEIDDEEGWLQRAHLHGALPGEDF